MNNLPTFRLSQRAHVPIISPSPSQSMACPKIWTKAETRVKMQSFKIRISCLEWTPKKCSKLWPSRKCHLIYQVFLPGSLGRMVQTVRQRARQATIMGCNTVTPSASAIAPTAKGTIEAPDAPTAAHIPIAVIWIDLGVSFDMHIIAAGNNGPRKKPGINNLDKLLLECKIFYGVLIYRERLKTPQMLQIMELTKASALVPLL